MEDGAFYQGEWDDDTIMMHGKGVLIDENGNLYEGQFC